MIYDFLKTENGKNFYRITLKIFRDCGPGTADFDGTGQAPALITVIDGQGNYEGVYDIGIPVINQVPPTINSPCMSIPTSVCVQQGVYTYTLALQPQQGGYYVIYQRCCRNNSILNLANPGSQGSTYYAFIPGPEMAAVNSSPRFKDYPPIYLCNGFDFSYAQVATDPDGDQLVYKFSTPFQGLDVCCPALSSGPNAANCPNPPSFCPSVAPPAPYDPVIYTPPYSATYPAASNPSLAIHPTTGAMSGAPSLNGQFVVNVMVEEYRGGKLLSVHYRDFQFNMLNCTGVLSQFKKQEKCEGLQVQFTNTSFNGSTFKWDFGIPDTDDDTSNVANPIFQYPDTGTYIVSLIVNPGKACSDTAEQLVRVYPPLDVNFQNPESQCISGNSFNFIPNGQYSSYTAFNWDFGPGAQPTASNEQKPTQIKFSSTGIHFIKMVASHFACIDSFIDTLHILPMPEVSINDPGLLCQPARTQFKTSQPPDQPLTYLWKTSDGQTSTLAEPVFTFSLVDTYTTELIGTVYGKCSDTASIKFTVSQKPKADFSVFPEVVSILEPEVQIKSLVNDVVHYYYTFGDGAADDFISGTHSYFIEGDYMITQYVVNIFGCMDSISKPVVVLPEHRLWIPDAFTPDGNGLNDTFGPTLMYVKMYQLFIYDRWGEQVFYSDDPVKGWDGTFRNKDCPEGVYVYKLQYTDPIGGSAIQKLGRVMLLRNH